MSPLTADCEAALPAQAIHGLVCFNRGRYFEAHEALEAAWRAEPGPVRDLYRGLLQAGVVYLHITRGNYAGALKVYVRCQKWLAAWPETCRGVQVGRLRRDLDAAVTAMQRLGPAHIADFDLTLLQPISYHEAP